MSESTPAISSDDLLDAPFQAAQMALEMPLEEPYLKESYFMNLSGEMISGVLRNLEAADLIKCAQISRLLNMLAVQAVLDQHTLWRPESVCNIMIASCAPRPPDVLAALLISIHITKLSYVSFDLTRIMYSDLEIPLVRFRRLMDRMDTVDDVAFHFTPTITSVRATSDKELKRLCLSFGDLFSTLISKSCTTVQFANLDTAAQLGKYCTFKRGSKSSAHPSVLTQFKGYLKPSKDGSPSKPKPLEDDVHYTRSSRLSTRMIYILSSPQVLEMSKLVRFDTSSINIFRPPFSAWAFSVLHSSRITHFSIGLKDLPEDKEESQYILDRVAAALPHAILLTIYSVTKAHVHEILTWLNCFTKIGTLSLPLNFPTDIPADKIDIHLPELWRLECAPALLNLLFAEAGRVNAPRLNSVAITQYGLDVSVLAECIPKAKEVIKACTTDNNCCLFLALRLTEVQIQRSLTPALREGIRPTLKPKGSSSFDLSNGFQGVSPLEVSLPGTREEVRVGIFDSEIMGILTLFPDVKSLIISSTEWYLRRPPLTLDRAQMRKFRQRSPGLHTLVAY